MMIDEMLPDKHEFKPECDHGPTCWLALTIGPGRKYCHFRMGEVGDLICGLPESEHKAR